MGDTNRESNETTADVTQELINNTNTQSNAKNAVAILENTAAIQDEVKRAIAAEADVLESAKRYTDDAVGESAESVIKSVFKKAFDGLSESSTASDIVKALKSVYEDTPQIDAVASVTKNGKTELYETLSAATEAALASDDPYKGGGSEATLTILKDCSVSASAEETWKINGLGHAKSKLTIVNDYVVDVASGIAVNGVTVAFSGNGSFNRRCDSVLPMIDVGNGDETSAISTEEASYCDITVKGCSFVHEGTTDATSVWRVQNGVVAFEGGDTVLTYDGGGDAYCACAVKSSVGECKSAGSVIVNGGMFEQHNSAQPIAAKGGGSVSISASANVKFKNTTDKANIDLMTDYLPEYYEFTLGDDECYHVTEVETTKITNLQQLTQFQKDVASGAIDTDGIIVLLENDITLEEPWPSIGLANGSTNNPSYAFKGTFDGRGHTINNVVFEDLSEGGTVGDINNYRGFFGLVTDGVIKNLTVSGNGFGDNPPTGEYGCAMLVGRLNTLVKSGGEPLGRIENCTVEGTVTGTHNAGGLCVQLCAGTIKNCTSKVEVVGKYTKAGGIAAFAQGQSGQSITLNLVNCVNEGSVVATGNTSKAGRDGVGGIIGYINMLLLTLDGCVNKGLVSKTETALSTAAVGQFFGKANNSATIRNATRARGDIETVGAYTATNYDADGLHYAETTVDSDGLYELLHKSELQLGGTYKVMKSGRKYTLVNLGDCISFDESLVTTTVSLASTLDPTAYSIEKTTVGDVNTYKVVAA